MSCEEELCKVSLLSHFKLACYMIDSDNITREAYLIIQEILVIVACYMIDSDNITCDAYLIIQEILIIVLCNSQHIVALVVCRK